ncbi:hypothetical protein MMC30_001980 [Trapelia coarctata]|nr:hypothetical protein [Trapelia coarctata]
MQLTSALVALLSFTSITTAIPHNPYHDAGVYDLFERDGFGMNDFAERDFDDFAPRGELLRRAPEMYPGTCVNIRNCDYPNAGTKLTGIYCAINYRGTDHYCPTRVCKKDTLGGRCYCDISTIPTGGKDFQAAEQRFDNNKVKQKARG